MLTDADGCRVGAGYMVIDDDDDDAGVECVRVRPLATVRNLWALHHSTICLLFWPASKQIYFNHCAYYSHQFDRTPIPPRPTTF